MTGIVNYIHTKHVFVTQGWEEIHSVEKQSVRVRTCIFHTSVVKSVANGNFCMNGGWGAQVENIAVLIVQCWCPANSYAMTGSWKGRFFTDYIEAAYFWGFFVLHQINTAKWEIGNEWMGVLERMGWGNVRRNFHAWRIIRDSLLRKRRPSANCRVPWYSSSEEILLITETRWACILGWNSSRRRGSCSVSKIYYDITVRLG
jgi:hypothetical protein